MTANVKTSVLLVEDTPSLARVYEAYLDREFYKVVTVGTGKRALEELRKGTADAVLLDLRLPDMDGLDILGMISEFADPPVVIVVTAHGSVNIAVEAMRLGAHDFLLKPFDKERLLITLANALECRQLSHIVDTYRNDIDRHEYMGFIGGSLPMQRVYRMIDSAAGSKATVFVTGESGVGKEICADAIHRLSVRRDKPFIAINCGAIPRDLIESEIFGHVKGAFTGALRDRDGAARLADGGTLFLDEICEMDISLQTKLLRFVQTGTFRKVGAGSADTVDVRFICATNRDPLEEVEAGRFREDLYYRLHVVPIHLPPLNERGDDVIMIARQFLADYAAEEKKGFTRFSPETEDIVAAYKWPGNVRQLQNVIRNVMVLHDGEEVTPDMLPAPLDRFAQDTDGGARGPPAAVTDAGGSPAPEDSGPGENIIPLAEVERRAIERAIAICGGNIPRAAHFLGLSGSTIYRKRAQWEKDRVGSGGR